MNLVNPHFAEPQWLWLALLGPLLLLALQQYSAWARRRQLSQFAAPAALKRLTVSHSPVRRTLKEILLVVALGAIGIAMARPQWGELENSTEMVGEDVVFILDCSKSMLATDVTPSRLERAKLAIMDYVQSYGRSRVGLVAFAGQAFLQCPLTFDYSAFHDALNAIDEKTIPVPGTDIARALDEAFRAMEKDSRRKLLILLTDGEDLEKGGTRMAEKLQGEGAMVFTIGVGTAAGSEIQVYNEQGQLMLLRDNRGQVVRSRLDEETLQRIARLTKGNYYPLGPLGEGLAKVRIAADSLATGPGSAPASKLGLDRFHWPVGITLTLLIMESLIGTRRRLRESRLVA